MKNKPGTESAGTLDTGGCAVATRKEAREASFIRNTYTVVCTEPVDEHRERFLRLREQIAGIEAGNAILRAIRSSRLEKLHAEIAAIPQVEKWRETADNLMPTVGKNNMLDNHWAGSAYTAAWYCGLINTTAYTAIAAGDTMASHGGWTEDTNYSQSTRVAPTFAAAASASKATSAAMVFTMNATTTIKGLFMNSVSTKGGTTGTLTSAVLFSGGDQACTSASTLNVTFTSSLT